MLIIHIAYIWQVTHRIFAFYKKEQLLLNSILHYFHFFFNYHIQVYIIIPIVIFISFCPDMVIMTCSFVRSIPYKFSIKMGLKNQSYRNNFLSNYLTSTFLFLFFIDTCYILKNDVRSVVYSKYFFHYFSSKFAVSVELYQLHQFGECVLFIRPTRPPQISFQHLAVIISKFLFILQTLWLVDFFLFEKSEISVLFLFDYVVRLWRQVKRYK